MSIELIKYQRDKNSGDCTQLRLMRNALLELIAPFIQHDSRAIYDP